MNGTLGVRVLKRVTLFYELTFEYVIGPAKNEIRAMATKFVEPKMSVIVSNLNVAAMKNPVICVSICVLMHKYIKYMVLLGVLRDST